MALILHLCWLGISAKAIDMQFYSRCVLARPRVRHAVYCVRGSLQRPIGVT